MSFKWVILVIVLVNSCSGQYPNIVPGLNGVLDPSFTGLPALFTGNGGQGPSFIGNPAQFTGPYAGFDPSLTGYPAQIPGYYPQLPGQLPNNEDDVSDVMDYKGRGQPLPESAHKPMCDQFCTKDVDNWYSPTTHNNKDLRNCCRNNKPDKSMKDAQSGCKTYGSLTAYYQAYCVYEKK